jgi:hypothetical protein
VPSAVVIPSHTSAVMQLRPDSTGMLSATG